jgi:hypothetical protein
MCYACFRRGNSSCKYERDLIFELLLGEFLVRSRSLAQRGFSDSDELGGLEDVLERRYHLSEASYDDDQI